MKPPRTDLGIETQNRILRLVLAAPAGMSTDAVQQATGLDTTDYWRQFQRVLVADDRAIWNWLTEIREHCPNVPAKIPNVRLLDVLLWMTVKQGPAVASR